MRKISTSSIGAIAIATLVSVALVGAPVANAAAKSVTCYKGALSKVVKSSSAKCPAGWSITKPVVKKTSTVATGSKTLSINATYTGNITMIWTDSDVTASSVTGTGTGTTLGLTQLVGSGSATPSAQCNDPISGVGYITDGTNELKANFDPSAQGCAKDGAAPTTVDISGNAIITGGTGKYAGASGTLKFTGSFPVNSTAAGTNETGALTITISGTFNTK